MGDLFPSITRYGDPTQIVRWKHPNQSERYPSVLELTDYPGKTNFIIPPADLLVPVYPPGVGPVLKAESSTSRAGRNRDCVLFFTDTRPGACVVWVARTNADSASDLLCSEYAVLAACEIADKNYKYLQICQGGAWRTNPLTGGSLVYFPVLFYDKKPTSEAEAIQPVGEVSARTLENLESLLTLLDAAASLPAKGQ